ncbi:histone deacetylase HOS3 [Geosmithia morbida]|uniref:Histone deacetylase HOS3 n=1 Tax=Geosmithia morbida TaxID=1094350 RepID=A0A9P4YWJ2_9HYPO|nr:histone deacetylase HOS3 [Geosmithia morbida]KAF4123097.1 histone deacetylase HOS3 [Geosmithia morbida]
MASSFGDAPKSRRSSMNPATDDGSGALTSSLSQLTISQDGSSDYPSSREPRPTIARKQSTPTPLRPPSSTSRVRGSSRSPSAGPRSRASSPTLHRKASMNSLHSANGVGPSQPRLRRASSGQPLSPGPKHPPSPQSPVQERAPLMTPASVAADCLRAELDAHHGDSSSPLPSPELVIILNDAVYGHRFSRPRTSRAALNTIVERPERIKAGVLGISLAYIRLGQRHSDGSVPLHPKRDPQALPSIPFRIRKTTRRLALLSQAVTNVHGTRWMDELKAMCESAESKLAMGGKELERRPTSRGGDDATPAKLHEGDLYLCSESLDALEGALGAVCEGIDTVFGPGPRRAFVGVRPPGHHCSASHPSGFCWVNNVHVGIMHAALNHGLTHAAIIDFDLHHGDGSQSIAWEQNKRSVSTTKNSAQWKKTSVGYFSLHDINSYPCEGGDDEKVKNASLCIDNAHGQTIWNVHLQPWATEEEFWELYESKYTVILEKARLYLKNQVRRVRALNLEPKAAIFLSAGFDASEWESQGMQRHQSNVPTDFYARISQDVVKLAAEEGLGVEGRVISVLEGGYSDRAIASGTCSHISGLAGNQRLDSVPTGIDSLGSEMGRRMNGLGKEPIYEADEGLASLHPYNPSWWAGPQLDKLEDLMAGPPDIPKKPRQVTPSTYSSPTQASTAKVAGPIRMRRSFSGLSAANKAMAIQPPSPPPPEVPWHVAAHELSKLLIPVDRQTNSCKHEDLNAEATRIRQARQATLAGVTPAATPDRSSSRMALRGRKPKSTLPIDEEELKTNRRRTVATTTVATPVKGTHRDPKALPAAPQSARRSTRRMSGASTMPVTSPTDELPPLPSNNRDFLQEQQQPAAEAPAQTPVQTPVQGPDPLPMKKTRTPTSTRKEPAAKSARAAKKTTTPIGERDSKPSDQRASTTLENTSEDMDSITSGMKKIKINLITQSQREARERSKAAAAAAAAAAAGQAAPATGRSSSARSGRSTPLASPTPELQSTVASLGDGTSDPLTPGGDGNLPTPSIADRISAWTTPDSEPPSKMKEEVDFESIDKGAPATALPSPGPRRTGTPTPSIYVPRVSVQPSSSDTQSPIDPPDLFIPYQPEGPPPAAVAPSSEPLKWLPPNMTDPSAANTPMPSPSPVKAKRQESHNLFHYTPGSIPFAPRPKEPTNTDMSPQ